MRKRTASRLVSQSSLSPSAVVRSASRRAVVVLAACVGFVPFSAVALAAPAEPSEADCKVLVDLLFAEVFAFHDFIDKSTHEINDPLEHAPSTPDRLRDYSAALDRTAKATRIIQKRLGDPGLAGHVAHLGTAFAGYHDLFEEIIAEGADPDSSEVKERWRPRVETAEAELEAANAPLAEASRTPSCVTADKKYQAEFEAPAQ